MISSDYREDARRKLNGKWGKAACITLAYVFIFFAIGFVSGLFNDSLSDIISLVVTVIEVPLAFGLTASLFKLFHNEDVKAFDFLTFGFKNFSKAWGISLQILLKMIVPLILIIASYILIAFGIAFSGMSVLTKSSSSGFAVFISIIGFILLIVSMIWAITKSYYYQLSYLVAFDNPELSSKDVVFKSAELMQNRRGKLFYLQLSFIGWAILASFTFGIGYLWLLPYFQFANISFYKDALGINSENPDGNPIDNKE